MFSSDLWRNVITKKLPTRDTSGDGGGDGVGGVGVAPGSSDGTLDRLISWGQPFAISFRRRGGAAVLPS